MRAMRFVSFLEYARNMSFILKYISISYLRLCVTIFRNAPLFISLLIIINTGGIERKRNNYCDLDLDRDCDLGLVDGGGGGDGDDDGTLLHRRHHYRYLRRGARRSRRRAPTGTFLITFLLSVR